MCIRVLVGEEVERTIVKWFEDALNKRFSLTRDGLCFTAKKLIASGVDKIPNNYNETKGAWKTVVWKFHKTSSKISFKAGWVLAQG